MQLSDILLTVSCHAAQRHIDDSVILLTVPCHAAQRHIADSAILLTVTCHAAQRHISDSAVILTVPCHATQRHWQRTVAFRLQQPLRERATMLCLIRKLPILFTAREITAKKKPPLLLQHSNIKQGGTGRTDSYLQFTKLHVQKHKPFRTVTTGTHKPLICIYYRDQRLTRWSAWKWPLSRGSNQTCPKLAPVITLNFFLLFAPIRGTQGATCPQAHTVL
jgi:hypothetical protein